MMSIPILIILNSNNKRYPEMLNLNPRAKRVQLFLGKKWKVVFGR